MTAEDPDTELSTEVKSLADIVSEKIRADFTDLIPDHMWNEMIAKEVAPFVKQEIPGLIRAALAAEAKTAIADEFNKPRWRDRRGRESRAAASEMVELLIKKNATEMIAQVFTDVVGAQIQTFIQQNRTY